MPTILTIADVPAWLSTTLVAIKVLIGFSLIIFVHEMGHFLAAKWVGIRVDRFAIGFGHRLFGWRSGEGFTLGGRPNYTADELAQHGWGETDYCWKLLPLGGYVKMLGQDDIQISDETGEVTLSDDPRAFTNKPVGQRMIVVSAGVIFNLLFAIVAFMFVFLGGRQVLAPQVSVLEAASPAAKAGLRSGDVVLEANGRPTDTFHEVFVAVILADDGVVSFKVQRDGEELPDELVMRLEDADDRTPTGVGLEPGSTSEIVDSPATTSDLYGLKPGDRITHVSGRKVKNAFHVFTAVTSYAEEVGETSVELTVERPDPDYPDTFTTVTVRVPVVLLLEASRGSSTLETREDSKHILGLRPRQAIKFLSPGDPADQAGLKAGDVIVRWGTVLSPGYTEIVESISANAGQPIPIEIIRDDETIELEVTPRRPFSLFGSPKPLVGVGFGHEARRPVVADVADDTPAAALNMPRGSLIVAIDGERVENWFAVIRKLKASTGKTVNVRYHSGTVEATGQMAVPSSIVSELGLPPLARVVAINDEKEAASEDAPPARLPHWLAVRALLEKHAGKTVRVQYQPSFDELSLSSAEFHVQGDLSNVDPWQMRIHYGNPDLPFKRVTKTVRADGPLEAASLGVKATGDVLNEVYRVLKSLAGNLVSWRAGTAKHVSGPVGIIGMAADRAKAGYGELLFFLAFLSVNLAVLNFIPLPVLDGGLMVFLIIEKLKGKPLSVKTQMVATLVGLATIVLLMLLVTFQDITKYFT